MTRACDRLYVCGWETKRRRGEGCWYDLVAAAIEETGEEVVIPGFDESGWRLCDRQEAEPDTRATESKMEAEARPLPDWAARPAPAEPEPSRPLSPSRPEGEEPPVRSPLGGDSGERFIRGRLIHALLQTLPDLPPEARRKAAESYLAREVHGLEAANRLEIAEETLRLLEDTRFAALFGPQSRAEVPLVGEVGGAVISAQIDRLLVSEDAVTVIDFKTNRPPPQDESAVPVIYLKQMAAYREALRRIYPDRPVRCLLLWTDGPATMALSDSLLDRHTP
jgi:ATP-dependent helicase/nuclease subunit A